MTEAREFTFIATVTRAEQDQGMVAVELSQPVTRFGEPAGEATIIIDRAMLPAYQIGQRVTIRVTPDGAP